MKAYGVLVLFFVSVFGHPFVKDAEDCLADNCQIQNNCRCSSTTGPIVDSENPPPQLVAITYSESIVQTLYDNYLKKLFFDRTNPDGSPVGITFFVNHEYTDYGLVQDLYVRGYEIGDHSVTKEPNQTYWRNLPKEELVEEFLGQRQIIGTFANFDMVDIVGVRTPQLQMQGDISLEAYIESEIIYDNSWPTLSTQRTFPYTLDYLSSQQCIAVYKCPVESHPGFWVVPITDIKGADDIECNSLATCLVKGSADDIANWLTGQLNTVRESNRAPLVLRLDTYWFESIENSFEGLVKFLDSLPSMNDVFMVTTQDVMAWMQNPVPLSEYTVPVHGDRYADCLNINCKLTNAAGDVKYMKSCIPCPQKYPWKGNPLGE